MEKGASEMNTLTMLPPTFSHAQLVVVAAQWLKRKCSVVVTELVTTGETPDAIGWQGTRSTLVECKVSVTDFWADRKKFFRQNSWQGIGQHRYFLTPVGLLDVKDLPPKWGLLESTPCGVCVVRKSETFEDTNHRHEIAILLSCLRRIGSTSPKGVSIRHYTIASKNTATLATENEYPDTPATDVP